MNDAVGALYCALQVGDVQQINGVGAYPVGFCRDAIDRENVVPMSDKMLGDSVVDPSGTASNDYSHFRPAPARNLRPVRSAPRHCLLTDRDLIRHQTIKAIQL